MRIAVIGGGISGLTAAYRLGEHHAVTLFEARERVGGHTHTVRVGDTAVDTGFIVYNERNYPRFITLLAELGVDTQPSVMSFGIRNEQSGLEYAGSLPWGLFAQPGNALKPSYWRFLAEIMRFGKLGQRELVGNANATVGEFLREQQFSDRFRLDYLLPMASAIWSSTHANIEAFPLQVFLRFFANHGLLDLRNRPQWRVIKGGSYSYVRALLASARFDVRQNSAVQRIARDTRAATVHCAGGHSESFDAVIIACHSDQALGLLADPTEAEQSVLGAIKYSNNEVVLHTDERVLPQARRARAAWNYWTDGTSENCLPAVTYSMNLLQSLQSSEHYLVTLNRTSAIREDLILGRYEYAHPQFDRGAIAAQARWSEVSGKNRTAYCGAYWGYGFHEDGVVSGERAAAAIGALSD